jgi:hypothetical protein
MPTAALMPMPKAQFFDNVGHPLAGGLLYTAQAGTLAGPGQAFPKSTFTDSTAGTVNTDPVVLDSAGRANIWLDGFYSMALYTDLGVLIYTVDNVSSAITAPVTVSGATYIDATAGPTNFNLPTVGEVIIIKIDATANPVTITATGGQTVLRQASISLTLQDESIHLVLNGINWYKI